MAEIYAALAAVLYAGSAVSVKKGVQNTPLLFGFLVSLGAGSLATVTVLLSRGVTGSHLAWVIGAFVVAGILGPGVGRGSGMVGVHYLGPSRSVPIQASMYPVFASTFAVLFYGETVEALQGIGLAMVGLGVWFLSLPERNPRAKVRSHFDLGPFRLPSAIFPLIAALLFGISDLFRKGAIRESGDALLGAAIGTVAAFTFWLLLAVISGLRPHSVRLGRGVAWFALSGLFGAGAITMLIKALVTGDVSVVTPIVATEPLWVLVLSSIFLRDVELLSKRIVFGATAVVVGTMAIGYFG